MIHKAPADNHPRKGWLSITSPEQGNSMSLYHLFKTAQDKINPYMTRKHLNLALQFYNLGVAVLVMKDVFDNYGTPNAKDSMECTFDIMVHLSQALLNYNASTQHALATLGANGLRLVDISLRMATGTATIPNGIAVVDTLNHFLNTVGASAILFSNSNTDKEAKTEAEAQTETETEEAAASAKLKIS